MDYCTQTDIENRYRAADVTRLADYDEDGAADPDVIAHAITDAGGELDGYLQKKFLVPVRPIPVSLRRVAVTIAWYYLQLGRDSVTDDARQAYKDAVKWLEGVASGVIDIGIAVKPPAGGAAPGVRFEGKNREFGRDKPL
jgi:phage gp36-like protein